MGVAEFHSRYDAQRLKWKRCRDTSQGQDAVHAAGALYLPILTDQTWSEYHNYVKRSPFYNATWRTIAGFTGMLFKRNPVLDCPEALKELLKNVTLTGVNLDDFAQNVVNEEFTVSRYGILVDYPKIMDDGSILTIAKAESQNLRPTMALYVTEAIRNWKFDLVRNENVLVQVRLTETRTDKIDEFNYKSYNVIRILDLDPDLNFIYRVRVFREDNETLVDPPYYPKINGQNLNYIPFYGIEDEPDDPVIIDVVDVNLQHYRASADYEHACHLTGVPTPYIAGYDERGAADFENDGVKPTEKQKFYMGSAALWIFPDASTKVGFLEFTGNLQALRENIDRKEDQMAAIGARMLAPEKAGVEAEGTLAIRHNGEQSVVATVGNSASRSLTKALNTFALWAGYNQECVYTLNVDFANIILDAQLVTSLFGAVQGGRISPNAFFDYLQRAGFYKDDVTFETEQARLDAAPLPTPKLVVSK